MPALSLVRAVTSAYGPIAFGLAALLILWNFIVGPELAVSRASAQEFLKASENYRIAATALDRVSERMERNAERMAATSERLERIESARNQNGVRKEN